MGDDQVSPLDGFLAEHSDEVRSLASAVMAMVEDRLAGATRMVYANFNATVVTYSPDGKSGHALCSVVTYPRWVNLCFFNNGAQLPDRHGLLRGTGSTVRSVRIERQADLDSQVTDLLESAIETWPWRYDPERLITTTIVSISKKRRPLR
jgi:hypothetical protein